MDFVRSVINEEEQLKRAAELEEERTVAALRATAPVNDGRPIEQAPALATVNASTGHPQVPVGFTPVGAREMAAAAGGARRGTT